MRFGWDISTSIIGVSMWDDNGKYVGSDHCDLRKLPAEPIFEKAAAARNFVRATIDNHAEDEFNTHYIEDRLGNFSGGRTMIQVLMKLGAFNALVSWFIYEKQRGIAKIIYIHPSTAKAQMKQLGLFIPKGSTEKKELTLDFVRKREPTFPYEANSKGNAQPWCYDMADAYILGLTGQIRHPCSKNGS